MSAIQDLINKERQLADLWHMVDTQNLCNKAETELAHFRAVAEAAGSQQCRQIDLAYTDKPCGKCAACLAAALGEGER